MLTTVLEAGAYAEAFTQFCEAANPREVARDRTQLQAWAQRNRWSSVQAKLNADPALQQKFESAKRAVTSDLSAHRFKSAFACGLLPQQLTSAAHDPSIRYGSQLSTLDPAPGSAATSGSGAISDPAPSTTPQNAPAPPRPISSVPAASAPGSSPSELSNPTRPSQYVVATTGEVAGLPPAAPVEAGHVSFIPPAGWQITKNSAEGVILQAATAHTKAVLLVTEAPWSGDFRTAFAEAVRTHTPVTGLQLRYPHEGVTGSGTPMIEIRDTGTLRGARQSESIDAVGVALPGNMVLAILMSGTWGGDNFGFQRAFEKMVAGWKLAAENGAAWDPLRPPQPVGARSGLFFGSRMQNQLNPLGGMDLLAVREYLVLLPSGQALRELPPGGHVLDVDFAAECTRRPNACGTYRIQGGQIDFTWRGDYGMVTHETSPFVSGTPGKSNVANFNGTRAWEVTPVQDLRIAGRYTSTFAQTGSIGSQSTSVVAQTFIAFSADGSYQKSGFSSASFTGSAAGGTVQNRRGVQTGHYALNGFSLTLTPSDGSAPEIFTTVFEEVSPSPKAVFIDDKAFLREGR